MYRFAILLAACTLLVAPVAAADTSANEELKKILEQNGAAAAYAKICDDEPTSDQVNKPRS
jgi:hypothetical protein